MRLRKITKKVAMFLCRLQRAQKEEESATQPTDFEMKKFILLNIDRSVSQTNKYIFVFRNVDRGVWLWRALEEPVPKIMAPFS